jgi:hypothetical protein
MPACSEAGMMQGMRLLVWGFTLLVCLSFALALGLLGIAALSTERVVAADRQMAQGDTQISGVVASVDQSNLLVIMRTRFGRAQSFPVSSADLLKDISPGDAISVELDAQGVATRITKTGRPDPR